MALDRAADFAIKTGQKGMCVNLSHLESLIILAALEAYNANPLVNSDRDVAALCTRFEKLTGIAST
jgi:hypothetical protein